MKTDEELMAWFKERLVWEDVNTVVDLVRQGLFVRVYAPQVSLTQPGLHLAVSVLGALRDKFAWRVEFIGLPFD